MSSWANVIERLDLVCRQWGRCSALVQNEGGQRTYSSLWAATERLGSALWQRGLRDESIVPLALGRSIDHVVGCLAAWYAGAAFLPIDLAWPDERIAQVLSEVNPPLVLTTADQISRFGKLGFRASTPAEIAHGDIVRPAMLTQGRLAYLIYTSGSTGEPKGVEVTHANIVRMLDAQIAAFKLTPGSRCLWHLSPAFDASISDIGTCLLAGATLYIERDEELRDPVSLTTLMHRHQITHVDLPPSLLPLLSPEDMPASLSTVIIGGEVCPPEVVRRWAKSFRLVNVYGPTEATVCTSLCVCDAQTWNEPLIGQPLPGIAYHVLNEADYPVEWGESGELYIGGACLARGYRARPELTASKFVRCASQRVYRTGDIVRRRADGEYVFMGRMDRMVKIRGQLVEPAEIEVRMRDIPGVCAAAVVPRDEALVAFVSGKDIPADREVRSFLARWLPASMQPRRIVRLPEMPRTSSGKIDYPHLAQMPLPNEETPANDGKLGELLALASEVLGGARLDPEQGFLDQGGDSLSLLRLVAAAGARGWSLAPALLAARSLRDVAESLDGRRQADVGAMSAAALRQDVERLAGQIRSSLGDNDSRLSSYEPATILLTGATGLLGSHLLPELLRQTEAEIVCLVRGGGVKAAQERLYQSLAQRGLSLRTGERRRIGVIAGDASAPNLGLSASAWQELVARIDSVYHAAAQVNLVLSYVALCRDNVAATYEILRLCAADRAKWLHHVSTLSVFVATDRDHGVAYEEDDLSRTQSVYGGYAQSKWAAEWLARRALPCRVTHYRPGLITPDSRGEGSWSRDLLSLFVRGVAKLGCLPECDRDALKVDMTPVDFAARALVYLSRHAAGRPPDTFHLAGPRPVSLGEIAEALGRAGVVLEVVSAQQWHQRLEALQGEDAAAWLSLCRALDPSGSARLFGRYRTMDLFQAGGITFDMTHALAGLAGSGIECPLIDDALLDRYVTAALRG
jgi:amino acid adenylation domain-containing protein/thioester reductase-like protein